MQNSCFNVYSQLFEDVQIQKIFIDSKTFADAIPKLEPEEIDRLYLQQKSNPNFDLRTFVHDHFKLPEYAGGDVLRNQEGKFVHIKDYIYNSWTILTRANVIKDVCDTEIQVPSPYVVPGGRFREMFYWDSYFTALGLVVHHRYDLLFALANNFKVLVDQFGYVPNGTRTYYLGRSQPPFYTLLIDLICRHVKADYWQDHLDTLEKEYQWWMQGESQIKTNTSLIHLVDIYGHLFNRYFQDVRQPRPEAYRQEDDLLAGLSPDQKHELYPHLRAAAESGWDFSGRWFRDPHNFQTIHTADFAPVDLNSLMYLAERNLTKWFSLRKDEAKAKDYALRAKKRNKSIREVMYNSQTNFFCDYIQGKGQSDYLTLAGLMPVFCGIATTSEADRIFERIETEFLHPGGVSTSLVHTRQQWDAPNGWAPLQYIAVEACIRYGAFDLAQRIKDNFCSVVESTYQATGTILEKYNVVDPASKPQDGEYEVQTGFGWTNGVYVWFKQ